MLPLLVGEPLGNTNPMPWLQILKMRERYDKLRPELSVPPRRSQNLASNLTQKIRLVNNLRNLMVTLLTLSIINVISNSPFVGASQGVSLAQSTRATTASNKATGEKTVLFSPVSGHPTATPQPTRSSKVGPERHSPVIVNGFSDIFSVGHWSDFNSQVASNNDLSSLFKQLPEFLLSSKAASTQKKYRYAFNSWCKWTSQYSFSPLPASHLHISLYLIHLSETAKSVSKLNDAFYAIKWAHKLAGVADPSENNLVASVLEGAHRKIGHSVVKKEPITPHILKNIVCKYANNTCNLKDVRIACMCLLAYAGFLRFSELANLRRSDIQFSPTYLTLHLVKSKTDVYREGKDVVISKTGNITCPVDVLQRYLKLANIPEESNDFIFRSICYCKSLNVYKLRKSSHISYTRARELLLSALDSLGLDKKQFGLHSLRSGGATAAAEAGIDDRLFKKHGRWKSDKAKDGYVKESNDNIHTIVNSRSYMIRFDLEDWTGNVRYAEYETFRIGDESDNYKLTLDDYDGDAGDITSDSGTGEIDGQQFSTADRDNANYVSIFGQTCADQNRGAWWYTSYF
ncbi:integrase/recombinase xerD homolog [Mytilus californianus]|uniref:integrase/recombinase xerD homolog n=1 Tax=Mytilus californianus TaxID=6549 RepID=UPI0022458656|nr:integrase/recombinase xerD homolog [Mytilus californianus]